MPGFSAEPSAGYSSTDCGGEAADPGAGGRDKAGTDGSYAGLVKLAVGMKLKNVVAGEGYPHFLTKPIRIPLK